MPATPYPLGSFGGLDLTADPEELGFAGAVDLLNVDLDRRGRIRARDGFDNFTASVVGSVPLALCPFYTVSGTKQLVVGTSTQYHAYNTSGTVVASASGTATPRMVRWGDDTAEYVIVVAPSGGGTDLRSWDGTTWTVHAGPGLTGAYGGMGVWKDRMVLGGGASASLYSRVRFSGAGDPFGFGATDWVDITVGDGEQIMALATYQDVLIAFKESRFAVFTGTSIDSTGNPIFNYRMVDAGVGLVGPQAFCVGRDGVYFLDRKGLYRTTGGDPQYLSTPIEPLFFGTVPSSYGGSAINDAQWANARMTFHQERVYIAVSTGASTTNDRLFVFDPRTGQWTVWNVPASSLCTFRVADDEELMFGYASGSTHVGRLGSAYTTDDGSAVDWSWTSGWDGLGYPDQEKKILRSRVSGTGTVTLSRFRDYQAIDVNAGAVVLGSTPATAPHLRSWRGTLMSQKLAGSGPAEVRSVTHEIQSVRAPGLRSALS